MIGKFIKKIWKDWPEYEMTVRADDLNKYEDTLKVHDDRLYALKSIDTDMTSAKNDIQDLKNASKASDDANNLVSITEEEKRVGTVNGYTVCQVAHIINRPVFGLGRYVISNAIPMSEAYQRSLLDVKVSLVNGLTGTQYTLGSNCLSSEYDPITNQLIIKYNENTEPTRLICIIQYIRETA